MAKDLVPVARQLRVRDFLLVLLVPLFLLYLSFPPFPRPAPRVRKPLQRWMLPPPQLQPSLRRPSSKALRSQRQLQELRPAPGAVYLQADRRPRQKPSRVTMGWLLQMPTATRLPMIVDRSSRLQGSHLEPTASQLLRRSRRTKSASWKRSSTLSPEAWSTLATCVI